MTSRLVIRADGSPALGLGHLLRCVALTEAARAQSLDTLFVIADDATARAALSTRQEPFLTIPHGDEDELSLLGVDDLLVVDGPHLEAVERRARDRVSRLAVVDDADGLHRHADVVVCADQTDSDHLPGSGPVRLLGPDHALVRREFRDRRGLAAPVAVEVLTLLGGTDATGDLAGLTDAVAARLPTSAVRTLQAALAAQGGGVADALARAGAAVSAAGTAAWELLCLGVPAALVVAAEDQHGPARLIAAHQAAIVLGPIAETLSAGLPGLEALLDPTERAQLSTAGRDLVDGQGAARVLDALLA